MSEQILSGLFGNIALKESPSIPLKSTTETSLTTKIENHSQVNLDQDSFRAELAYAVKNISASSKQANTFEGSRSTILLNQEEDVNLIIETISRGILHDTEGLQERLSQTLNNNMCKETCIIDEISNISDGNTTTMPTQLHTLLLNNIRPDQLEPGEGILSTAKSGKLYYEVSYLVKAIQNNEETSPLVNAVKNDEEILSNSETLKNAVQNNGEASLAKPLEDSLGVSSLIKATRFNGDGISSVTVSAESEEAISLQTNNLKAKDLYGNTGNMIQGQKTLQDVNNTVAEDPDLNLLLGQDSVKAELEGSELRHSLNFSKAQDFTKSLNDNIPSNIRIDGSTNHANISQDSYFSNNQGSDTAKVADINLINFRQGIEPKANFANVLSQVSITQPFESLGIDLVENFVQRARLFMQGDRSAIRLQLNPPELGSLKLEFSIEDEVLEAKIFVERPAVKEIIEKDIPRLRELISNTEVDVGKLDVFLQERGDERLGFMEKGFQSDLEGNQTREDINQENEDFSDEVNEELELNEVSLNKINYLV